MSLSRFKSRVFVCSLALCFILTSASLASAQGQGQSSTTSTSNTIRNEQIDLEIQLHLLVASNAAGEGTKLSGPLDATVRPLRSSLPFNNYRWAATFINRVNNGGNSSTKGIAGPLLGTTPPSSSTPSFYDLIISNVGLSTGAAGQELVRLNLHFGARLPVVVGGGNSNVAATINYEGTGLSTTISIPENEPVVVGTMSLGPTNEMLVLVISVKRIS